MPVLLYFQLLKQKLGDKLVILRQQYIENGLHIKSHPHIPIEKPFSKTHAPVFGLILDGNF